MKAKVEFIQNKNYVAMVVHEMDERFRNVDESAYKRYSCIKYGIDILSDGFPEITSSQIELFGCNDNRDNYIATFNFNSEKEASDFIERAKLALQDWAENWEGFKEEKKEEVESGLAKRVVVEV